MNNENTYLIDTSKYDFLDFGCSAGASLERYGKMFNAEKKGLGLDINPEKVKLTIQKGFDAQVCDITKLQLSDKIKFGIMHHFLEHIPSTHDVSTIIKKACSVIDDFLIIRQPYFDANSYLFSHGFKLFWSDWKGHPNHMTLLEFHNILMPMVNNSQIKSFSLYGLYPITNSEDPNIHNIDSKIDQHEWNSQKHTNKKLLDFSIPVYKEVLAIIDISGNATTQIESIFKPPEKFFSSDEVSTK